MDYKSLSLDSLRKVTLCCLDMNQEAANFILASEKDNLKDTELLDLVKDYLESSKHIMNFCSSLEYCLDRARSSQSIILVALQNFQNEAGATTPMLGHTKLCHLLGKLVVLSKQRPLSISRILRWRTEEKPEPVDTFRNASDHAVVRSFLYLDDGEKSKKYIKNLVYYDDEVPDPNIDALKREFGDTCQFRVKMELASSSRHEHNHDEDQVQDQDQDLRGMSKDMCNHCGRGQSVIVNTLTSIENELVSIGKLLEKKPKKGVLNVFLLQLGPVGRRSERHCNLPMLSKPKVMSTSVTFKLVSRNLYGVLSISVLFTSVNFDPVNALDGSPLSHPDYVDDAHDGLSSPFPDQVDDAKCKILPLTDLVHVHNDDGPSIHLPDPVDNASCKTLPSEVVDSAVDSGDRSPDGRITDVLAQIMERMTLKSLKMLLKMAMRLPMKKLFEQLFKFLLE
ncbi:hypothetical protein K7X08_002618 [Anisodus acutangulus]|uniref:Uncharacterized protein n=1 Tax=Anisodus acutangulus TaxID=402998 RepID=A0A9Q1LPS9_9SOLA|nr:hypothetical protein K7X08_002618 [Anisodus acutangulus]